MADNLDQFAELRKLYEKQYLPEENQDVNEEINLNDYELAEEENEYNTYVSLLNIYTCYFKQLFRRQQNETMFDHLDEEKDSTKRCMEYLYEEINKLNKSEEPDKETLYSPNDITLDIEKCTDLYILYLDDTPAFACKFLLPLMGYLATKDWLNISWSIIPIKTT